MKLTTARLKKLIREELNKISEAPDDLSQMGSDMGFMGEIEYDQPLGINEKGEAYNIMFSVNGNPDYDFVPNVLNKEKLKDNPIPGQARSMGDITLMLPKQKFKIGKDGKFGLKSKDGQIVLLQIPEDQMQELL